jgi:hypothetical protein
MRAYEHTALYTVFLPQLDMPSVQQWQRAADEAGFAIDLGDTMTPAEGDDSLSVSWQHQVVNFSFRTEVYRPTTAATPLLAVDIGPYPDEELVPVAMVAAACARAGAGTLVNNETGEEFNADDAVRYALWLAEPNARFDSESA